MKSAPPASSNSTICVGRWLVKVPRKAASLKSFQLRPALSESQCIDRDLSRLAIHLQLKPVFKKRFEHGSIEHGPVLWTRRFRIDFIQIRRCPGRSAGDREK